MYGQFVLPTEGSVVHLAGVWVVLPVAVPDLALLDDAIKQQRLQLFHDVSGFDFGVLDLLLDVFFFIGEVLVHIGVALNVGLLLQQIERSF